jgi:hypothetical protein
MSNNPGQDRPGSGPTFSPRGGAGGVFAEILQGSSPKYSFNQGIRGDTQQRNTLARMYLRVDREEYDVFLNSIGDSQVRSNLAPRIAGDPTQNRNREQAAHATTGYVDFLITQVQERYQEKVQVSETLADNYVAYFFGQAAPTWNYSGFLINSKQDDQATNFVRLYSSLLRGTQLARRQKIVSLKYDSYIVAGAMTNLVLGRNAANELLVQFSFDFLVKRIYIVNYTSGWSPTQVGGAFATDPNNIVSDGRPREEGSTQRIAARTPAGTEQVPGPGDGAHPNVQSAPAPDVTGTDAPPMVFSEQETMNPVDSVISPGRPEVSSQVHLIGGAASNTRPTRAVAPPIPSQGE